MAKTLLQGVNEVLKAVGKIAGDSGALASLTDSPRQHFIDVAVQSWNEGIEELYRRSETEQPKALKEGTITLATNDRDYTLASDVVDLIFPLLDQTEGQVIVEYPGGYREMVLDQLRPSTFTGLPYAGAIRDTDGQLYLDRLPTANENGRVYTYWYNKDVSLSAASDTMPFPDAVFRAMVPMVAEIWKRKMRQEMDPALFALSLGRAARLLTQTPVRTSWSPL